MGTRINILRVLCSMPMESPKKITVMTNKANSCKRISPKTEFSSVTQHFCQHTLHRKDGKVILKFEIMQFTDQR